MSYRPHFPCDALPAWLAAAVDSIATRLQVAHDLPAVMGLTCISAAVGRSLSVEAWPGFEQPALLWSATALESGEAKTPVVDVMRAPIRDFERETRQGDQARFDTESRRFELLKKRAEHAVRAAAASDGEPDLEGAAEAMKSAETAKPRPLFRALFDSATPEAFVRALEASAGYLAHIESESDFFDDVAGRYDSEGLVKPFLDAFDGGTVQLDRVSREGVRIESARIVVGVATQPETLSRTLRRPTFRGRGLLERCLFSMPFSMCGGRDVGPQAPSGDAELVYRDRLRELCHLFLARDTGPRKLVLEADARQAFVAARQRIELKMGAGGELEPIRSWAAKLQGGTMLRIAAVLAIANHPTRATVSVGAMESAAKLVEDYFIPHALYTLGQLRGPQVNRSAERLHDWVAQRPAAQTFSARDLMRARSDLFDDTAAATEALEHLVDEGVLESFTPAKTGPGRPPSQRYRPKPQTKPTKPTKRAPVSNRANAQHKGGSLRAVDSSDSSELSAGIGT